MESKEVIMTRTAALVATGSDNGYGRVSGSGEWSVDVDHWVGGSGG